MNRATVQERTASPCTVRLACGTIIRATFLHSTQFARLKDVSFMDTHRCCTFVVHNFKTNVLLLLTKSLILCIYRYSVVCDARNGSSCYVMNPHWLTWEDARSWCEAGGGHLVTIDSQEENDMIHNIAASKFYKVL